jgi:hypothetical protein
VPEVFSAISENHIRELTAFHIQIIPGNYSCLMITAGSGKLARKTKQAFDLVSGN